MTGRRDQAELSPGRLEAGDGHMPVRRCLWFVPGAQRLRLAAAILFPVLALLLVALAFADRDLQAALYTTAPPPLVNHVAGFFVLSLVGFAAVGFAPRPTAGMAAALIVLGIAIELGQAFVPHRQAAILDAAASAAGVVLALLLWRLAATLWRLSRS